ncbi:MAG TPA: response regulator [Bacteroidota bacterium]|jgi:CheY-like chemotaxis protein
MNILIIEDDAASRMLLEKLLNSMGHQVKSTGAVLPAFEMIRKGDLDLILMDIRLPGLSGISFTRKLKTYPEFRDIPIIAMTGYTKDSPEHHAIRSGCDAYLEKPIDSRSLETAIATVMSDRKAGKNGTSPPADG